MPPDTTDGGRDGSARHGTESGESVGDGTDAARLAGDGAGPQRVLVVDDEPGAADLAATYLERLIDRIETEAVTDPLTALERVRERRVDCVVSDHDMPKMNGLELLEEVRATACDLPFVLFTGKGSEEIASDAISAGVTDYLQKGTGSDQYEVLANRVDNALRRRRAEAQSRARGEAIGRYETILATLRDPVFTVDDDGRIAYVNDALRSLTGVSADELCGSDPSVLFEGSGPPGLDPHDRGEPSDSLSDGPTPVAPEVDDSGRSRSGASPVPAYVRSLADAQDAEVRVRTGDGRAVTCESRVSRVEGSDDAVACVLRDVSERVRAEAALTATNRKITAMHAFAQDVSGAETASEVFEEVVGGAQKILEFDRCVTARRDGDRIVPEALSSALDPAEVKQFDLGEGIAGRTVAEERTFVVDEVTRSASADPVPDDVGSVLSVPIGEHGLLQAVASEPAAFDEADVEFAELLASHASEAIDQIEAESKLRRERDRLAALFDNVPLPVARILIDDDAEAGYRLDATNAAFESTFGCSADEHTYTEVVEQVVPSDGTTVSSDEVDPDGEPIRSEVRRRTVDGVRDFILHAIPTEHDDDVIVYSVYADIDEQKRVERTLRGLHEATREMFNVETREETAQVAARTAIDTLEFPNSGVRLYDPDEHVLQPTAISDEATAAIGERPSFGPGDGALWESYERSEVIRIRDIPDSDTVIEYGDLGSLLVVPLGDHGVMPLGSLDRHAFDDTDVQLARVLAANVTVALDRARQTEQLRERDDALQRELERLEKFAGVVSHDLRNPLNVATGHLELARDDVEAETAIRALERVADAHDRMERLIEDLLALARQGRTVDEPESVSLAETAARAWNTVDTSGAELHVPDGNATVEADPERLRTALENLFRNAIEHGSEDEEERPTVTVEPFSDGFAVSDDGPGFDIEPERAVEYGISERSDGTGFGLAIVREIAAAHGWTLRVVDDDGARIEFRRGE